MQFKRRPNCFTLIELLVVISIIALLAGLALPAMQGVMLKGQLLQAMSNAKQVHLAVQSAALDYANTQVGMGWPNSSGVEFASAPDYVHALFTNGVFKVSDSRIFVTGSGFRPAQTDNVQAQNLAYNIYNVDDSDDNNTIFMTTKNLAMTDDTGSAKLSKSNPFGEKGFIVVHRGGDGQFYSSPNALRNTNTIGSLPQVTQGAKMLSTGGAGGAGNGGSTLNTQP